MLEGLYGTPRAARGRRGRRSPTTTYILRVDPPPAAKVVEGWEPIMPAFDGAR